MSIKKIKFPEIVLKKRKRDQAFYEKAISEGESLLTAIIAANRSSGMSYKSMFSPSLMRCNFSTLKNMDLATKRLLEAKENNETIGLVTDFDVDGITSMCVLYTALIEYLGFPKEKIKRFANNRILFGYDFNDKALNNIISRSGDDMPTLLITADQGSNMNNTICRYKEHMKKLSKTGDVIVTDHHHINEGETCSASVAFINPQQEGDEFDDKTICGCVVALAFMIQARYYFIEQGNIPPETPSLKPLLTYASLATVADCVSLKSEYNRFIVRKGIHDINAGVIPAWVVLRRSIKKPGELVDTKDLGFLLGPAINADSRTGGDGENAIRFLLAKTVDEAEIHYANLINKNNQRKEIEFNMKEVAFEYASKSYYNEKKKIRGFCFYLPDGSHGIHGIVASRVKEKFNCPTLIFSPVNKKDRQCGDRLITASGRSVDGINIRDIVERISKEIDIIFGGHPMALGVKLKYKDFEKFAELFNKYTLEQSEERQLGDRFFEPYIYIDHLLQQDELNWLSSTKMLKDIVKIEPYGQKFEAPIFAINGVLSGYSETQSKKHLRVSFTDTSGVERDAMLWNYREFAFIELLEIGKKYTFAFEVGYNSFMEGLSIYLKAIVENYNSVY